MHGMCVVLAVPAFLGAVPTSTKHRAVDGHPPTPSLHALLRPRGPSLPDRLHGCMACASQSAFFTETPSSDAVWTCSVVRVLVIPKAVYDVLAVVYANQVRLVLTNLQTHTEKVGMLRIATGCNPSGHVLMHTCKRQINRAHRR